MKLSANLGFLWPGLSLPQQIERAQARGFDAVECHWPYAQDPLPVRDALQRSGLPMLSLNTLRGASNGLCAMPDDQAAESAILQAIAYADAVDAQAIHCMAGQAPADSTSRFVQRLQWAADQTQRTLLIEPLNPQDAPGYFLNSLDQALEILAAVDRVNVRLLFDLYHVQRIHGEVTPRLLQALPWVEHIQFAGAPHRGHPLDSELNIAWVARAAIQGGYQGYFGAEYKTADTEASLDWLDGFRRV